MAITGIEIFKWLPKTNCGECGVPTCLAFAMSLAAGKMELAACPYVSEEAKAQLEEASAPPIRPVSIGVGDRALKENGRIALVLPKALLSGVAWKPTRELFNRKYLLEYLLLCLGNSVVRRFARQISAHSERCLNTLVVAGKVSERAIAHTLIEELGSFICLPHFQHNSAAAL